MNASRLKHFAIRATVLSALLVGTAGVAMAQKVKPAGPPVTTKGAVNSNPKADKGQATAEAARVEARERKAEKSALQSARKEPKSLLKGIKFTRAEKKTIREIDRRYDRLFKDMENSDRNTDKAGTPDAEYLAKIEVVRLRQRAEIRAALTPEQRNVYDSKIAALGADK
jgi:hypothetical protein